MIPSSRVGGGDAACECEEWAHELFSFYFLGIIIFPERVETIGQWLTDHGFKFQTIEVKNPHINRSFGDN